MKLTKRLWDEFWRALDKIGTDWAYDEIDIGDGFDSALATEVFSVCCGIIIYQGDPAATPFEVPGIFTRKQVAAAIQERETFSLPAALKRFISSQSVATVVVQVPIAAVELLTETVKTLGGTVVV